MIRELDKKYCCGCSACMQICPQNCITMQEDEEGFLYPELDLLKCINCNACKNVCPMSIKDIHLPKILYAAKNKNEFQRISSSSGGVFISIAEMIINSGGVVFAARFNERWEVIHDYATKVDELQVFKQSKYVQSKIGDSYLKVEKFLKNGKSVLFVGTPCQIAGLKKYLTKEYEKLMTIDFVCHGVPSPNVWRMYLKQLKIRTINFISFRDKSTGWENFSITIKGTDRRGVLCKSSKIRKANIFFRGFLSDLYLRPSCHYCNFRCNKNQSDITISDCWGINKYSSFFSNDGKGWSAIIIRTNKFNIEELTDLDFYEIQYNDLLNNNPCLEKNSPVPVVRRYFFFLYKFFRFASLCYLLCVVNKLLRDLKIEGFLRHNIHGE